MVFQCKVRLFKGSRKGSHWKAVDRAEPWFCGFKIHRLRWKCYVQKLNDHSQSRAPCNLWKFGFTVKQRGSVHLSTKSHKSRLKPVSVCSGIPLMPAEQLKQQLGNLENTLSHSLVEALMRRDCAGSQPAAGQQTDWKHWWTTGLQPGLLFNRSWPGLFPPFGLFKWNKNKSISLL